VITKTFLSLMKIEHKYASSTQSPRTMLLLDG